MDEFLDLSPASMLWLEEVLSMNKYQSAFVSYTNEPIAGFVSRSSENVHKRMIRFLKKNWTSGDQMGRWRGKKHAIGERLRRKKHKRLYGALHKLLPPGTKSDQQSILEMAIKKIKELRKEKEELERRNNELEIIMGASKLRGNVVTLEKVEIELKVGNPASGINDSMLGVLKSLKHTNSSATAIRSKFSDRTSIFCDAGGRNKDESSGC